MRKRCRWCGRPGSGEDSNGPDVLGFNDSKNRFVNRLRDLLGSRLRAFEAVVPGGYSFGVTSANSNKPQPPVDSSRVTGVFAKQPEVGKVKTRFEPFLAPILGNSGPAELAAALLQDAAERYVGQELGLELVYAPAEAASWFAGAFPDHKLRAQRGDGLGERMASWFVEILGDLPKGGTAVAIGADSPWTSVARVRTAHELLRSGADVVLGPDFGGGYYLVGLREPQAGLFTEIEMSTGEMFDATCGWIEARGLRLALLDKDYDLDAEADWRSLERDLQIPRSVECDRDWPKHLAAFADRVKSCQNQTQTGGPREP